MATFTRVPLRAWVGLGIVAVTVGTAARQRGDAARPLPPHDYSLVVPEGADRATAALARVREGLHAALLESKALPDGFPQAGVVVHRPSDADARAVLVSCSVPSHSSETRDPRCIRLGPESFVELGTVDYPDSRAYLFEVFLFDEQPDRILKREAGLAMTRITVHYPIFRADVTTRSPHAALDALDALQRGLLLAGARPMRWKESH